MYKVYVKEKPKNLLLKFTVNEVGIYFFQIINEKNRNIVFATKSSDRPDYQLFFNDNPRIFFHRTVIAKYWKQGLLLNITQNGSQEIPMRINFRNSEPVMGNFATEKDVYTVSLPISTLLDSNARRTVANIRRDTDGTWKIIIPTLYGPKKTTPEMIFAIFLKYFISLIEEQTSETVTELNISVSQNVNSNKSMELPKYFITKIEKLINVKINYL